MTKVPGLISDSCMWNADAQETALTLDEERLRSHFSDARRAEPATLMRRPIELTIDQSASLGEPGRLTRVQPVSTLTCDRMQFSLDILAWRDKAPSSMHSPQAEAATRAVLPPGVATIPKSDRHRIQQSDDGRHDAGYAPAAGGAGTAVTAGRYRHRRHAGRHPTLPVQSANVVCLGKGNK